MTIQLNVCEFCGGVYDPADEECTNPTCTGGDALDAAVIALEPPLRNVSEMDAD